MSDPNQSTAQHLETSFRSALASAFFPVVSAGQLSIWVANTDLLPNPDSHTLPGIILSASVKDWDLTIRIAGRYAEKCSLKIECRVAGNVSNSSATAEALLSQVRAAIENPATAPQGWNYLYLDRAGTEEGFSDGARVLTALYELSALPV